MSNHVKIVDANRHDHDPTDKSEGPLKLGRADAMNARTLQLLQLLGDNIFEELHAKGLHCNSTSPTSSS